jgi:hypothetical protein
VQHGPDHERGGELATERPAERAQDGVHAAGDAGLAGRDGLHDQVAQRGERQPDPHPEQRGAEQHIVRVPAGEREPAAGQGAHRRADHQRAARATARMILESTDRTMCALAALRHCN